MTLVLLLKLSVDDFKYKAPPACPELLKKDISVEFTAFTMEVNANKAPPCSVCLAELPTNVTLDFTMFNAELFSSTAL